jgi:hypothetical protein
MLYSTGTKVSEAEMRNPPSLPPVSRDLVSLKKSKIPLKEIDLQPHPPRAKQISIKN